jgi:hypothetical protein
LVITINNYYGLEEDALNKRIGTFGQRTIVFELITGHEIKHEPRWRKGENHYSKCSIEALQFIPQK